MCTSGSYPIVVIDCLTHYHSVCAVRKGLGVHTNVCVEGVETTNFHACHSPIKQLKVLPTLTCCSGPAVTATDIQRQLHLCVFVNMHEASSIPAIVCLCEPALHAISFLLHQPHYES